MKNTDQIKALAVAIEEKENIIRKLSAEVGNLEVQNADYQQIVKELSDKLELNKIKDRKWFIQSTSAVSG